MKRQWLLVLCSALVGCGSEVDSITMVEGELYTIKDLQGNETQIPRTELNDPETGKPVAKEILVIDKQTNKQMFVPLENVDLGASVDAKVIPVTSKGMVETKEK